MLDQTTKVFSGADDDRLPSNVQGLSVAKRRQWVGAWNSRFEDCKKEGSSARECESSAFAVANSAIKKDLTPDEAEKFYDGMVESWDIWGRQFEQLEVNYNSLGASADKGCANCRWFLSPGGCVIVTNYPDAITPNGISDRWEAKKVYHSEPLEVVIVESQETALEEKQQVMGNKNWSDKILSAIASLKGLLHSDPISPFVLYKDKQGNTRWFAWASNKWRDRDNPPEILSDKSHQDYVDYVDRTGDFPEAWLWHTPGSKWGKADWVEYSDGFLMASGTVDQGREHVADFLAHQKDLGVSHGFRYLHSDAKEGIIGWYRTFEVSPLPVEAAANQWTSLEVLRKELEDTVMNAKKRDFLVGALGEDEVKRLENNTEGMKAALEKAGIQSKDIPEDEPQQVLVLGEEQSKAIAEEAGKAAALAILEAESFKGLVTGQATMAEEVKGLAARILELEKTDDIKIAAAASGQRVRPAGHQASADPKNTLTGKEAEAEAAFKGPSILDEVMVGLELQVETPK